MSMRPHRVVLSAAVALLGLSLATSAPLQLDRLFRAGLHTQTTAVAGIGVRGEGLLAAVDEQLDAPDKRQLRLLVSGNGTDGQYVIGADRYARPLGLAAHRIDDRDHESGFEFAVGFDRVRKRHILGPLIYARCPAGDSIDGALKGEEQRAIPGRMADFRGILQARPPISH